VKDIQNSVAVLLWLLRNNYKKINNVFNWGSWMRTHYSCIVVSKLVASVL